MAVGPRYRVPFRRRREGKTDYRQRLRLLRSEKTRMVVRRSLRDTTVQFIDFGPTGDLVRVSAKASEIRKLGWQSSTSNVPSAYLAGYLAGKRALAKGIDEAILDIGLHVPSKGGKVFATLKGAVDAGVFIPHSEDVLPSEERIMGSHLKAETAKITAEQFEKIKAQIDSKIGKE